MTKSREELKNGFERDQYETTIRYLNYGGEQSDKLSFPMQFRERHFTPETTKAELQAIGPELQVSVWSERDNVMLRLPLDEWETTRAYSGKLSGPTNSLLSVGRFEDNILVTEEDEKCVVKGFVWTHYYDASDEDG